MSKSRNDIPCMGGTARLTCHANHKGTGGVRQDAIYQLINPATHKPYTYKELAADLALRKKQYPALAAMVDVQIAEIAVDTKKKPNTVFTRMCCGAKTKDEAKARAKRELWPQLCELARLLYRPVWEINVQAGEVTMEQFVDYMADSLMRMGSADAQLHTMSCLRRYILPVIGKIRLCDLTAEAQKNASKKINRMLAQAHASATQKGYVRQAYRNLVKLITGSGYQFATDPVYLADMIDTVSNRNSALLDAFRARHLDDGQRARIFTTLKQPQYIRELCLVALCYSGLELNELSALCWGDIIVVDMALARCYMILVTRMSTDKSVAGAQNDKFAVSRLRRVVLYPWAAQIVDRYLACLRQKYTDRQIAAMRLADLSPASGTVGAKQITAQINQLMLAAGLRRDELQRTAPDGTVHTDVTNPDVKLIQKDAKYIAETCCGLDLPAMHAMFGAPITETDEQSYLDVLSIDYAVARYLCLRRFTPFDVSSHMDTTDTASASDEMHLGMSDAGGYTLRVQNDSERPQTLMLTSNFAVNASWR